VGGDSWALGTLCRRPLRSLPEMHLLTVAPTRSGKTTRVLLPALLEHRGPAIVLLNKTDVLHAAAEHRAHSGPVHLFAPLTPADALPMADHRLDAAQRLRGLGARAAGGPLDLRR